MTEAAKKKVKFSELANFTEKQSKARELLSRFKFVLYGGAMGGGKSYWLRWTLLRLLLEWGKQGKLNVRVGLFCEDYPALRDRHLSKIEFEFPEWIGKLNSTDKEFKLNPEYGGGVICFRNLDDVSKYQSAEFAAIAVDELTKNERETFDFLRTRLRWFGIDDCKFIAGTNPGDIGHAWVRQMFIDKEFDDQEKEPGQFAFLQALAEDNPYLSKSYLTSLDSLPIELQRAYRRGDWDVFKGQFFAAWRQQKNGQPYHVIPDYLYDRNLDTVYGSMDWGFEPDAFAYHLHAVRKISLPDASFTRVTTFAELYGTKRYPQEWAKVIKELERDIAVTERFCDPSCQNRHPVGNLKEDSGTSVLDQFYDEDVRFTPGNNDRKNGYQAMRDYLSEAPDGLPYWQITESCSNLRKQIPSAVFDDNNSFLTKGGGEDHAREGVRYFIISGPKVRPIAKPQPEYQEMSLHAIKERVGWHSKKLKGVGGYATA